MQVVRDNLPSGAVMVAWLSEIHLSDLVLGTTLVYTMLQIWFLIKRNWRKSEK